MTFRTADGNLTFTAFANLVAELVRDSFPDVRFYEDGSPVDDVKYPVVTWRNAGRTPYWAETGRKTKIIENVYDEETDEWYKRRIRVTRNIFRLTIKADRPEEADEIADLLEDFIEEIAGALIRRGIKRIMYAGRTDLDPEEKAGKGISRRQLEWIVHEERSTVIKESTIKKVEMFLRAVTEEGEGEDSVSSSLTR